MKTYTASKNSPSRAKVRRAVASSTAIETGQPVKKIEQLLKNKNSKFKNLKLAR